MDPENVGKETILKVTNWLRRIWEMRRRTGPVQQWIDSIPSPAKSDIAIRNECQEHNSSQSIILTEPKDIPFCKELKPLSMTVSAPVNVPNSPTMKMPIFSSSFPHRLVRDASFQSDSSHCSSVESLLELRRADPAAILLDLGFGGCSASPQENGPLSRIPKRFLQPSMLQGIALDEFLKQQQQNSESFDSVSLGYRGLTGSPYVAPSEIVQKIMERLREHESHEADTNLHSYEQYSPLHQNGTFSVLSPDNRQFLEQPRSKSPDMRNKRMIIGQKSFAFGCDGNLIEISSNNTKLLTSDDMDNHDSALETNKSIKLKQSSEESVRSEHRFSKNDKKLAKQLSFNKTVEFSDTDQLLKDDQQSSLCSLNIAQSDRNADNNDQKYNISNINPKHKFSRCHSDIRRASDGSCDTESLENMFNERRRFSDGAMRTVDSQSKEYTLMQKRKSLKRQSRICDTTTIHYSNLNSARSSISNAIFESNIDSKEEISNDIIDSTHQLNILKSFESVEDENDLKIKIDIHPVFPSKESNCMPSSSKIGKSIDKMEHFETIKEDPVPSDHSCTEFNQICCYKNKICKDCKHSKKCSNCCYYVEKQKYLKKMEKIMEENKKLEDMLARNRREIAEIRNMLNNVLSIRMEPGF